MATQADYGWELPDLSDIADGPDAFLQFADDVAGTIKDGTLLTYTPSWQTVQGQRYPGSPDTQPFGLATRIGRYSVRNKMCWVQIFVTFGDNSYGAYGGLSLGLPLPASNGGTPYQMMPCSIGTPRTATVWNGQAFIDDGSSVIRPHFPISTSRVDMLPWSSVSSLWTNSAIPQTDSGNPQYTNVQSGGYVVVQGTYRIA